MTTPKPVPYWDSNGRIHYPTPPATHTQSDRAKTADQRRWLAMGDHTMRTYSVVPCRPDMPGGYFRVGTTPTKNPQPEGNDPVKVADINTYIDNYLNVQSDLTAEENVAFNALTGRAILTFNKNFNVSENSDNLNKNIIDIVTVVNSLRPTELIKLQNINGEYFSQFPINLNKNTYTFNKNVGLATIYIPKTLVSQENRVQIQTLTVGTVNNDTIY